MTKNTIMVTEAALAMYSKSLNCFLDATRKMVNTITIMAEIKVPYSPPQFPPVS